MYVKQPSIADKAIWRDVRERWKGGERLLGIVDAYMDEKGVAVFQIKKILLRSTT